MSLESSLFKEPCCKPRMQMLPLGWQIQIWKIITLSEAGPEPKSTWHFSRLLSGE